jgi:hypothetical protein
MSDAMDWWQPPLAGTEAEHLVGALDRMRTTFQWKADGLNDAELQTRYIASSALTIGSLLKHLAACEDHICTVRLRGDAWEGPRPSADEVFASAGDLSAVELYALWDDAVARSRATFAAAIAEGGLDQPVAMGWGGDHANLRRLLCDLLEEYGRHTGHADLIREAIDGRVGEDPPRGWTPIGARLD